jgi:hypothetical protein
MRDNTEKSKPPIMNKYRNSKKNLLFKNHRLILTSPKEVQPLLPGC